MSLQPERRIDIEKTTGGTKFTGAILVGHPRYEVTYVNEEGIIVIRDNDPSTHVKGHPRHDHYVKVKAKRWHRCWVSELVIQKGTVCLRSTTRPGQRPHKGHERSRYVHPSLIHISLSLWTGLPA